MSRVSPLGEPLSPGYGVIELTGLVQVIFIAVPGAALACRLDSVDLKEIPDYTTFWKVKALLIRHASPAVRAPIFVCM